MPVSPVPPPEPEHSLQPGHDPALAGWGQPVAPLPPQPLVPGQAPTRARRPWWVWSVATFGVFMVVVAIVLGVLYFATDTFEEKHGGKTEEQAQALCEDSGKDRLKAPTTAVFEFQSTNANEGDDGWDLRGRVSAQNGYGAMTAESFRCFTHNDNANFWFNSDFEDN